MDIAANLKKIKEELGKATLVAVSKTKPKEETSEENPVSWQVYH